MARAATGQVIARPGKRATSFALRFRHPSGRTYLTLGTSADGWNKRNARRVLRELLNETRLPSRPKEGTMFGRLWRRLLGRAPRRFDGCKDLHCHGPNHPHGVCKGCGEITCSRGVWIDEKTLRRRLVALCYDFDCAGRFNNKQQDRLRGERTRKDWDEVSVPVNALAVEPARMVDQYDGAARQAVRAFLATDAAVATVPDVDPATLGQVIQTLGLESDLYAEQRGKTTVLRRAVAA